MGTKFKLHKLLIQLKLGIFITFNLKKYRQLKLANIRHREATVAKNKLEYLKKLFMRSKAIQTTSGKINKLKAKSKRMELTL